METPPLKTRTQIEEFAFILTSTSVKIPPNVTLMVKMDKEDFENIVPEEFKERKEPVLYHSRAGIFFSLCKE